MCGRRGSILRVHGQEIVPANGLSCGVRRLRDVACMSRAPPLSEDPLHARASVHTPTSTYACAFPVAATCIRWASCTAISSECPSEHPPVQHPPVPRPARVRSQLADLRTSFSRARYAGVGECADRIWFSNSNHSRCPIAPSPRNSRPPRTYPGCQFPDQVD